MKGPFDLLVRGGDVVVGDALQALDIGVEGGRIAALLPRGSDASAARVLEAAGKAVLPGVIDSHVHVRAPSYPERGTVLSETRAAAAGGVTTILEMPIAKPCCATAEILRTRRAHFAADAVVNKPRRVATTMGVCMAVANSIAPKFMEIVWNTSYRMFPDSEAAKGTKDSPQKELSSEQVAMAAIMKGVHF